MIYAAAQQTYTDAGWTTVMPLKGQTKEFMLNGFSGAGQRTPTQEEYAQWVDRYSNNNICLVLPQNVIGIDVDTYGDKTGNEQWADFIIELGLDLTEVDTTWISSGRNPAKSGIRWYRVPAGFKWKNKVSKDIEIIQHTYRYAVVSPSIHPETGSQYKWYAPGDKSTAVDHVPAPTDLKQLPKAIIDALRVGELTDSDLYLGNDMDFDKAGEWLDARNQPNGPMCEHMERTLTSAIAAVNMSDSCHDAMITKVNAIVKNAAEGCKGVVEALEQFGRHFVQVSFEKGRDGGQDPVQEFKNAVASTVNRTNVKVSDCSFPLSVQEIQAQIVPSANSEVDERMQKAIAEQLFTLQVQSEAKRLYAQATQMDTHVMSDEDALEAILAGFDVTRPTIGTVKGETVGLFYEGCVNAVFGDGGSGKTLYLYTLMASELNKGNKVVLLEFDNRNPLAVIGRLLQAGTDPSAIRNGNFKTVRSIDEIEELGSEFIKTTSFVVLDSLNGAVSSLGIGSNDANAIDQVLATYMTPFTLQGACGVFIDHAGHMDKTRQAGSIRKSQALQGALYQLKSDIAPSIGQKGIVQLTLKKDNQGGAGVVGETAGWISYTSDSDGNYTAEVTREKNLSLVIKKLNLDFSDAGDDRNLQAAMKKNLVLDGLEEVMPASATTVYKYLESAGKAENLTQSTVRRILTEAVAEDEVSVIEGKSETGGRKATLYTLN